MPWSITRVSGMVQGLEDGALPEQSADVLYSPTDSNPGGDQMFGDANLNIEQLIIRVAQETHGLNWRKPGGSFTVVQWRCLLQALIWQESRFTIGARSPVGAFGLTQIMPPYCRRSGHLPSSTTTARTLQVEGGARYLSHECCACLMAISSMPSLPTTRGPAMCRPTAASLRSKKPSITCRSFPAKYNDYLTRVGGVDALGTIDPALLGKLEPLDLRLVVPAFTPTARCKTSKLRRSAFRNIVRRIGQTQDVQESLALNTYARAELVRLVARPLPGSRLPEPAHLSDAQNSRWPLRSYRENQFMDFTLEDLD